MLISNSDFHPGSLSPIQDANEDSESSLSIESLVLDLEAPSKILPFQLLRCPVGEQQGPLPLIQHSCSSQLVSLFKKCGQFSWTAYLVCEFSLVLLQTSNDAFMKDTGTLDLGLLVLMARACTDILQLEIHRHPSLTSYLHTKLSLTLNFQWVAKSPFRYLIRCQNIL